MKTFKKLAVIMLSVMVLFGTMTVPTMAAANSPAKKAFTTATLKKKTVTYNGKNQKPVIKTVKVGKKTLKAGKNFKVVYPKKAVKAGKYTVTIKGIGKYAGYTQKITYTIKKASQKVTAPKTVAVKANKKKAVSKTVKLTKKAGKVTWTSSNANIKVSKNGKITVAKGTKKGTYTVKATVKAANYKTVTKTIKVKVK